MSQSSKRFAVALPTTPVDWVRWGLGAAIVAIIYYAFWVQTVELGGHYAWSCYEWLRNQWGYNYTHGPLIPLITVGLLWFKLDAIRSAPLAPWWGGALVLAVGMGFYWLGVKAMQPRMVVIAFVTLLHGLTLTLAGRAAYGRLFFPLCFLYLMVPLSFLDNMIGFPLQLFMARASAVVLNVAGIEAVRFGTSIRSAVFDFDVANPCSGIRSLMALTTVTAAYGYITQRAQWKRWLLFLSAIPLAVLGNLGRVLTVALVGQVYGREPAMAVHDYSGFIVFGVALTAMVGIGLLLNAPYQRIIETWFKPVAAPPVGGEPVAPLGRGDS